MDSQLFASPPRGLAQDGWMYRPRLWREGNALSTVARLQDSLGLFDFWTWSMSSGRINPHLLSYSE